MIKRINEVKTLAKHFSCNCKCKFNGATCNSNEKWNNNKCKFEYKKYRAFKKDYTWNSSTCVCENNSQLKSIVDGLVIVSDEITSVIDNVSTNVANTI